MALGALALPPAHPQNGCTSFYTCGVVLADPGPSQRGLWENKSQ